MNWVGKVRELFHRRCDETAGSKPETKAILSLPEWFAVTFDDKAVYFDVRPPGKEAWTQQFAWESVQRVCFNAQDFMYSDEIYVFTTQRPERYLIPTEAKGGSELWSEIIRRKLFDAELAIKAATSVEGLFCCPPMERPS